jgi:hypothetical protein
MVLPVLSQRTYPGVGDIDDCWVIATVWAAASSKRTIAYPTVTTFRKFAGKPDLPGPSGGNIWDCNEGADGCWPDLQNFLVISPDYDTIKEHLKAGRPGSAALDSAALPERLRYNFFGKHQVGIQLIGTTLYCMNPLAVNGATPDRISYGELEKAMEALVPGGSQAYRALFFPKPAVGAPLWGWDVDADIKEAYGATAVGRKLKECGIKTWGERINEVDLEAGFRARGQSYGSSVQKIDMPKLMKPGCGP